jgi:hypothetical protein
MEQDSKQQPLIIPWLTRQYTGGSGLGSLDDIDYAAMLEELEYK